MGREPKHRPSTVPTKDRYGAKPDPSTLTGDRPRLLTLHEVAGYLQVHPKTVQRWIAHAGLPCVRIGKSIRFDPTDVLRWVSAKKEG
jgi:excisionase family DNA binding protein